MIRIKKANIIPDASDSDDSEPSLVNVLQLMITRQGEMIKRQDEMIMRQQEMIEQQRETNSYLSDVAEAQESMTEVFRAVNGNLLTWFKRHGDPNPIVPLDL